MWRKIDNTVNEVQENEHISQQKLSPPRININDITIMQLMGEVPELVGKRLTYPFPSALSSSLSLYCDSIWYDPAL